jgi:plasmid replication initiation protein
MAWTVISTMLISVLTFAVLVLRNALKQKYSECSALRRRNDMLTRNLKGLEDADVERRIDAAYKQGLYDGRETDALYRSVLAKHGRGEQFTLMFDGNTNNRNT